MKGSASECSLSLSLPPPYMHQINLLSACIIHNDIIPLHVNYCVYYILSVHNHLTQPLWVVISYSSNILVPNANPY